MKSSPFVEGGASVRLQVETGSPLAEVFLIDHAFALVDRAIGHLDKRVDPGVYKVKAQLGDLATEELVVVNQDKSINLSKKLLLSSPVPLRGTSNADEEQMDPAAKESRKVTLHAGSGAQMFLCARRWSDAASGPSPLPFSPPELSLHWPSGEPIVDLMESGQGHLHLREPLLGATVEVDPGSYIVRWRDDSGSPVEQTVVAVRNWQTQVFLVAGRGDAENPRPEVSVLMARDGFSADDETLRRAEEARAALADERKIASEVVSESLFANRDNPMLGLFGAHLMLLARDADRVAKDEKALGRSDSKRIRAPVSFDQALFDHVVGNLRELLGPDHPDATALATQTTDQRLEELQPVTVPPMLWRSWVVLIAASNERPALVPVDTWRRSIRVLPVRPFFVWSPDESTDAVNAWQRTIAPLVQQSQPPDAVAREVAFDMTVEPRGDDPRQRLSLQLLAPRAAIDELAADSPAGTAPA